MASLRKRMIALSLALVALFGSLILRVYSLTGETWSQVAEQQATMTVTVANSRGTIYDRSLQPLTNTTTEYRASVTAAPQALAAVSALLSTEERDILARQLQDGRPAVATLSGLPPIVSGVTGFSVPVRNNGYLPAPHVVGYLDGDGKKGATGIELAFDDYLQEHGGKAEVTYTVDAVGRPLQGVTPVVNNTLVRAKAGVALTLDKEIQLMAERIARRYIQRGAVIVMEPDTGRILAMVSLPDFQPDTVADCLTREDSPLLNRALRNYNCGSVFKIVSTATALEAGITLDSSYTCTGSIGVGEVTFHCHNRLGHGTLSFTGAFAQSCNPYFIQLMRKVGGTPLYQMAVTLGFERPVLLCDGMQTARAALPSLEELQSPAAVSNLAIGQGALLATPVHIAQMTAAAVNDGKLVRPTLLQGYVAEDGTLTETEPAPAQYAFSKSTAQTLRNLMVNTLENGTGAAGKPFRLTAGGKTGTAETGWKSDSAAVVQSWFTGFFPATVTQKGEPRYVITVLAEDSQNTASKSAPVFKELCEALARLNEER